MRPVVAIALELSMAHGLSRRPEFGGAGDRQIRCGMYSVCGRRQHAQRPDRQSVMRQMIPPNQATAECRIARQHDGKELK